MRLLVLATNPPSFRHAKAVETVAAALIEAWLELGVQVVWATAGGTDAPDPDSQRRLEEAGAVFLGDYSQELVWPSGRRAESWLRLAKDAVGLGADLPRFRDPDALAARLQTESGADAAILFWDSWFEHLLPSLGMPSLAYWARPRYASPLDAVETGLTGPSNPLLRMLVLRGLHQARKRHLQRAGMVDRLTNICAVDAAGYRDLGLGSHYVSNTWPDPVGAEWQSRRQAAEQRVPFSILGAMGSLTAAGTTQGMRFWASGVLPELERRLEGDWNISVCGRNADKLPADLRALLEHPRVTIKGFVPDIDEEILSSAVFLMCNNAGSYSGGYTRVIYAMATGACMVAHRGIAHSMPEVRHGENALLGETPQEIAGLVEQAYRDPELRKRIGVAARATYETQYHPRAVARKLADLAVNLR